MKKFLRDILVCPKCGGTFDIETTEVGLYSSHLTTWRKAAHSGSLKALSKKRGRKPERNPLDEKVRKLERRNARLENELRKAHLIIDVQGKVAGLLGISLDDGTNS